MESIEFRRHIAQALASSPTAPSIVLTLREARSVSAQLVKGELPGQVKVTGAAIRQKIKVDDSFRDLFSALAAERCTTGQATVLLAFARQLGDVLLPEGHSHQKQLKALQLADSNGAAYALLDQIRQLATLTTTYAPGQSAPDMAARELARESLTASDVLLEHPRYFSLSVRIRNALAGAGIESLWQLINTSESTLEKIQNMGAKSVRELTHWINAAKRHA